MAHASWLARAALFLLVCSMPLAAAAQTDETVPTGLSSDEEARMRFELGRRYYDTGRFADAAAEFAEAHRLSGRMELLYNLFLAYRDAGDDVHAAETLRTYLPTLEAGERRTQLEARLRVLEERLARTSTGPDETTPPPPEETTVTTPPAEPPPPAASGGGLGVVPWVVVGVGAALVVGSVITGVLALDARSTLNAMCTSDGACPPGYEATQSSGQTLAITTDILWITGAVAIGAGVILAIVDSSGGSSDATAASIACDGNGCMAMARGSF